MWIRNLVYRAGANPRKSWRLFIIGLGIFALGVLFILFGAQQYYLLQIPGLVLLLTGFLIAAWGYFGIFANRFSQLLNRVKPPSFEDN
ncbi:hypothetical protein [Neptunicella sp. SCSIO 80796]|uniref:hypothetical protein n=1 Tax=Neptunicella plasticusilytica TaxID=3117012 RepID=UPI003A4DD18B